MTPVVASPHTKALIARQYMRRFRPAPSVSVDSSSAPLFSSSVVFGGVAQATSSSSSSSLYIYVYFIKNSRLSSPTRHFSNYKRDLLDLTELYLVKQNTWMFLIEAGSEFDKWISSSPSSTRLDQSLTSSVWRSCKHANKNNIDFIWIINGIRISSSQSSTLTDILIFPSCCAGEPSCVWVWEIPCFDARI